jgi:formate dehydrogenase subunit gamma
MRFHGAPTDIDPASAVAQEEEDVLVGEEIVRHKRSERIVHWTVSGFFLLCVFTGMPIWSPIFGWMSALFGGLEVCRWLHPWAGVAFSASMVAMTAQWARKMILERGERRGLASWLVHYMRWEAVDDHPGKYNPGQKLLFWAVLLAAVGMLATGIVMWFPYAFHEKLREAAILLHDVTFVLFFVAIVFHVYLGTAAEPGTFRAMTRGTVSKPWAKLHHPNWFRDVTGEDAPQR